LNIKSHFVKIPGSFKRRPHIAQANKVIVVGAGIAGLSAGIYAQKSGFGVTIYEAHSGPGGNCTGWRRNGYYFEGSMHWLNGSHPDSPIHRVWRETGAINDDSRIIIDDPFITSDYDGQQACLYRDIDTFEAHLYTLSPEDTPLIRRMCADIRRFTTVDIPLTDIFGLKVQKKAPSLIKLGLKMLPAVFRLGALGKISAQDYANRFHSPAIRLLILSIVNPDFDAVSLFFTMAQFLSGDGGYVAGGTVNMVRNMVERFTGAGGVIRYNTRINRVVVENGRATGVIIGGETVPASVVIITSDTLTVNDTLFVPPLREPWLESMSRNPRLIINTFICLGVEADLTQLPRNIVFPLEKPFVYNGQEIRHLACRNYASYPGYAPAGCSALTVNISGDSYDYWKAAREAGLYEQRKQEIFETVLERLETRFPAIAGKTTVRDVATPLTYERYCGTYRGSWMTKTPPGSRRRIYPSRPKSVTRLYFAGQRMEPPGGLPVAVTSGRRAAQYLCRDFGVPFGM
jgi:phytoene dehydrogenase-like protein